MQAQNMLASQRCAVQPRATLRTAQFGSCNALRGVRLTMRFIGGGELSVGVLSRHASLKLFNRRMPTEYVDLQRSYILYLFLFLQASPVLVAARPVARPQMAMRVVAAATAEQTQAVAIMRFQRGSPLKVIEQDNSILAHLRVLWRYYM